MDAPPPQPGYETYQQPLPAYAPHSGPSPWIWVFAGCGCVVFMIVVLLAVLFPVFMQAREKARQTSCLSNVKQMSLGVLMYAQDYDEMFPPSEGWMENVVGYDRNERSYHCPSVSGIESTVFGYAYHSD